jgi:hypothetical protein
MLTVSQVTLVPLYQSEVSPAESRGLMVGLHGVLIGFSYSLTGFITYACYFAPYGVERAEIDNITLHKD